MTYLSPLRTLVLICLASAGWGFSFGLGSQVISHWLKGHGQSDATIGLNHSTYYLGLALASLFVPWMMRRWGKGCAPAGLIISSLTLGLFPWGGAMAGWFTLRLLSGMGAGMSLIPLETLVSKTSGPEQRARNFGFYSVALTLSGALGIWAGLRLHLPGQTMAFILGSIFPFAAALALLRWLPNEDVVKNSPAQNGPLDFQRHFLSYGTAWSQGFLEGGMLAFLSFFLISLGLSVKTSGDLMGATLVGVIIFQVPVAWLADRLGHVPVLLGCYGVVVVGLVVIPLCGPSMWLGVCLFFLGACSGAFYPLGLAILGEGAAKENLPRVFAWYMAMECFGSQMGAALMGKARDWWGEGAMFGVGLAAVLGILLTWLTLRTINFWHNRRVQSPGENTRRLAA